MSNETTLAALLERNSELFATYGAWAAAQTKLLAGTIDDPDSYNAEGGKTGALGYYPVENVSGQIIYVPSLARLQVIAAGGGDLSAVEALVDGAVAAKEAALAAQAQAEGLVGAASTALQPGAPITALAETADAKVMTSAERAKLDQVGSGAKDLHSATTLVPASGDLGEIVFAILDAADFFGAGLGKDGAWSASKLRALTSMLTPLLSVAPRGAIQMGAGSALTFDGDGLIKGAGSSIGLRKSNYDWAICDEAGNVALGWKDGKLHMPKAVSSFGANSLVTTYFNGAKFELGNKNYDFCICDDDNNVLLGWMGGRFYGPTSQPGTASFLDVQDAKNKAHTARVYKTRILSIQRPTADYNVLIVYGQSLAQGDETWPALSRENRFGNLMLGNSVQPHQGREVFDPIGGVSVLNPLVAITIDGNNSLYPDETTIQASGGARGEPINHGWANGARFALAQHLFDEDYSKRQFVSINVAWSGATIGELEKGHTEGATEKYGRYPSALQRTVIAAGEGKTVVLSAIAYMQGEHDYFNATGHDSQNRTYATYRPKLEKLVADMQADAMLTLGQSLPPAFLIYQTSGSYTRDADANGVPGLHIGMAQLDVSNALDTVFMVGPAYPYTDKGGHLDSNGSRWFGHQFAKVYEQVVIKGRGWEPLRPLRVWQEDPGSNVVYVGYHVPVAPLVFDEPQLSGGSEYSNPSRGFRVTDATGNVSVTTAEIVRDTIIKLTCSRSIGAGAKVWYASQGQTNPGNGMVRDSDPAVAIDNYVYEPERGMYATANIPQFVGKPYPLWNWSVAFCLPIGHQE